MQIDLLVCHLDLVVLLHLSHLLIRLALEYLVDLGNRLDLVVQLGLASLMVLLDLANQRDQLLQQNQRGLVVLANPMGLLVLESLMGQLHQYHLLVLLVLVTRLDQPHPVGLVDQRIRFRRCLQPHLGYRYFVLHYIQVLRRQTEEWWKLEYFEYQRRLDLKAIPINPQNKQMHL
jgi:hypothetical protein